MSDGMLLFLRLVAVAIGLSVLVAVPAGALLNRFIQSRRDRA